MEINVNPRIKNLKRIIDQLATGKLANRIVRDVKRLGNAAYYDMKKVIPVSKLSKPHLRDSWTVEVSKLSNTEIRLQIYTSLEHSKWIEDNMTIPSRVPSTKSAMKWTSNSGQNVFSKFARGFNRRGIHHKARAYRFIKDNYRKYIDMSLLKYI